MALNGLYPVMLVSLEDALTPVQSDELNRLMALANPNELQLARITALKSIATATGGVLRMPIILDGEIIAAQPEGYNTTMVKQMQVYGDNTIGVKSTANTVTINIATKSSKDGISIFPDIIFSIADIIFSKNDNVPRFSYFGDNIIIPNGYITRISKSSRADTEREVISIEVQKDLDFAIPGITEATEPATPFSVDSSWSAQ